jgi:cyclase
MSLPILRAAALAVALLAATAGSQAQDFSKVQIKTEKLTDSLYMLTGQGGNIGVSVGKDALFVVDDQFAPLTPKIKAALAKLSKLPVKFVLNTHWHFDHVGGNENLGKQGAAIVAHDNVRKRMSTDQVIEFLDMKFKPSPHQALPVVTFTRDLSFHLNGEDIYVFHLPNAHTDGDAIVHFRRQNVFHMGDIFFNKLYPFIDTSSGGTVDGVLAAVDKVLAMSDDASRFIPGHGPLASKAELLAYRAMLAALSERVKKLKKEGKTVEQTIAAKPTADFDAAWGKGFLPPDKFVAMLWRNIKP